MLEYSQIVKNISESLQAERRTSIEERWAEEKELMSLTQEIWNESFGGECFLSLKNLLLGTLLKDVMEVFDSKDHDVFLRGVRNLDSISLDKVLTAYWFWLSEKNQPNLIISKRRRIVGFLLSGIGVCPTFEKFEQGGHTSTYLQYLVD